MSALSPYHQAAGPDLWRIGRFLVVGAIGTLLDLGLFTLFHSRLGLPALPANVLAYGAGIANNYLLHRRWTYADRTHTAAHLQAAQFLTLSLTALALNTVIVLLLGPLLGALLDSSTAGDLLAKLIATGFGLGWNLLVNHAWTFRDRAAKGVAS